MVEEGSASAEGQRRGVVCGDVVADVEVRVGVQLARAQSIDNGASRENPLRIGALVHRLRIGVVDVVFEAVAHGLTHGELQCVVAADADRRLNVDGGGLQEEEAEGLVGGCDAAIDGGCVVVEERGGLVAAVAVVELVVIGLRSRVVCAGDGIGRLCIGEDVGEVARVGHIARDHPGIDHLVVGGGGLEVGLAALGVVEIGGLRDIKVLDQVTAEATDVRVTSKSRGS